MDKKLICQWKGKCGGKGKANITPGPLTDTRELNVQRHEWVFQPPKRHINHVGEKTAKSKLVQVNHSWAGLINVFCVQQRAMSFTLNMRSDIYTGVNTVEEVWPPLSVNPCVCLHGLCDVLHVYNIFIMFEQQCMWAFQKIFQLVFFQRKDRHDTCPLVI